MCTVLANPTEVQQQKQVRTLGGACFVVLCYVVLCWCYAMWWGYAGVVLCGVMLVLCYVVGL